MTLKCKRILVTIVMCILFSTTVYAVNFQARVYSDEYKTFASATKNDTKDYATVTLTVGPVEDQCMVGVYLERTDNTYYKCAIGSFSEPGTKYLNYFQGTFNPTNYIGKVFDVKMKVNRTSPITSTVVYGSATP